LLFATRCDMKNNVAMFTAIKRVDMGMLIEYINVNVFKHKN